MPCACNVPLEKAATKEVWGPILWKLLHALAEKTSYTMSPTYQNEEKIFWISLIKNTQKIIPCEECKAHYADWLLRNNPTNLKTLDLTEQRLWIRNFFWELHEEVNKYNKKSGMPFESLPVLYKNIDLNNNLKELDSIMKLMFQHNVVTISAWQNWVKDYKKLQSLYGI